MYKEGVSIQLFSYFSSFGSWIEHVTQIKITNYSSISHEAQEKLTAGP